MIKFAMVSLSEFDGRLKGYTYDIFAWLYTLDAMHHDIETVRKDVKILNAYDVVILLDCDRYLDDALTICRECKCKTIFYPEGTIEVYLKKPFGHQERIYKLLQSVDLIGTAEEDRGSWYESIYGTKTFFMHVPVTDDIINGKLRSGPKEDFIMVCCNLGMDADRWQTNIVTSLGVLKRVSKSCILWDAQVDQILFYNETMGVDIIDSHGRSNVDGYLIAMRQSMILLNPSAIIGTCRNALGGASIGTPVIGNRDSHTQRRLWPRLGTYIYDIDGMVELVNMLYKDTKFYNSVCDYAFGQLKYYSMENTKKRLLDAVEKIL